jgi:hypothetical protein
VAQGKHQLKGSHHEYFDRWFFFKRLIRDHWWTWLRILLRFSNLNLTPCYSLHWFATSLEPLLSATGQARLLVKSLNLVMILKFNYKLIKTFLSPWPSISVNMPTITIGWKSLPLYSAGSILLVFNRIFSWQIAQNTLQKIIFSKCLYQGYFLIQNVVLKICFQRINIEVVKVIKICRSYMIYSLWNRVLMVKKREDVTRMCWNTWQIRPRVRHSFLSAPNIITSP